MEQNDVGPSGAETPDDARQMHPFVVPVAAGVDQLPSRCALRTVPQEEVIHYAQDLEIQANRIYAASLTALADLDERGLPAAMGPMSLSRFVAEAFRFTDAEARRRVRAMRAVQATVTPTGTVIAPALSATAAAIGSGAISPAHLETIASIMNRLPKDLPTADKDYAENILLDAARTLSPTTVAAVGKRLIDTLDPDGTDPEADEAAHAKKRGLWMRQLDDHSYELKARLTPELGATLRALIDFLSTPVARKKLSDAEHASREEEFAQTTQSLLGLADDGWDPRSPCQRHLDALAEIIDTFLNGGSLAPGDLPANTPADPEHNSTPEHRSDGDGSPEPERKTPHRDGPVHDDGPELRRDDDGGPPTDLATADADGAADDQAAAEDAPPAGNAERADTPGSESPGDADPPASGRSPGGANKRRPVVPQLILYGNVRDFAANTGTAHTGQGDEIPMWAARQIVREQTSVFAVSLATTGCVLDEGRTKRLATRSQIAAVIARDRGCTIRGCSRPISRCQVHHVKEWVADLGPTTISNLAAVCFWHHRWFAQLGYACTMINGVPHWTAPAWIDPEQTPRRHERFDTHSGLVA